MHSADLPSQSKYQLRLLTRYIVVCLFVRVVFFVTAWRHHILRERGGGGEESESELAVQCMLADSNSPYCAALSCTLHTLISCLKHTTLTRERETPLRENLAPPDFSDPHLFLPHMRTMWISLSLSLFCPPFSCGICSIPALDYMRETRVPKSLEYFLGAICGEIWCWPPFIRTFPKEVPQGWRGRNGQGGGVSSSSSSSSRV